MELANVEEAIPNLSTVAAQRQNSWGEWVMPKQKIYDLPPFGGEAELWPGFHVAFKETSEAYGYNNLVNMQRLQKSLTGAAREAVSGMLIYPDNVPDVIRELEFRFGRPEILINSQLNKVRQIGNIADEDIPALINFSTKVKNMTALFRAAKLDNHLANPTLIESLVTKLPISLKREWAKYLKRIAIVSDRYRFQ